LVNSKDRYVGIFNCYSELRLKGFVAKQACDCSAIVMFPRKVKAAKTMKAINFKMTGIVTLIFSAVFCSAFANAQPSDCENMERLASSLSAMDDSLSADNEISDKAAAEFDQLIKSLHVVAASEKNEALSKAIDTLENARIDGTRAAFSGAISKANVIFISAYKAECDAK
jgi:hypothetical protein